MIKIFTVTIIIFFTFTTGCSKNKKETFCTVDFYQANPKVRDTRIKECKVIIEMTDIIKQDCSNASKANRKSMKDIDLNKNWGKAR